MSELKPDHDYQLHEGLINKLGQLIGDFLDKYEII